MQKNYYNTFRKGKKVLLSLYKTREGIILNLYKNSPLVEKIENSLFLKELEAGTLSKVALEHHRKQDRIYLYHQMTNIFQSNKFLLNINLENYVNENIQHIQKEIETQNLDINKPIEEIKNYIEYMNSFSLSEKNISNIDKLLFYLSLMPCASIYTDTCLNIFHKIKNIEQHPLKDVIISPLRLEFRKFDSNLSDEIEILYTKTINSLKNKYQNNKKFLSKMPEEFYQEIQEIDNKMIDSFNKGLEHELKFYNSCILTPVLYKKEDSKDITSLKNKNSQLL